MSTPDQLVVERISSTRLRLLVPFMGQLEVDETVLLDAVVHPQLINIMDQNFGYRPTAPAGQLLEILAEELPKLRAQAEEAERLRMVDAFNEALAAYRAADDALLVFFKPLFDEALKVGPAAAIAIMERVPKPTATHFEFHRRLQDAERAEKK